MDLPTFIHMVSAKIMTRLCTAGYGSQAEQGPCQRNLTQHCASRVCRVALLPPTLTPMGIGHCLNLADATPGQALGPRSLVPFLQRFRFSSLARPIAREIDDVRVCACQPEHELCFLLRRCQSAMYGGCSCFPLCGNPPSLSLGKLGALFFDQGKAQSLFLLMQKKINALSESRLRGGW